MRFVVGLVVGILVGFGAATWGYSSGWRIVIGGYEWPVRTGRPDTGNPFPTNTGNPLPADAGRPLRPDTGERK
jgi:hypothetical protein